MPERNECLASYFVAHRWFTSASCSFRLQELYVDATKSEAARAKSGTLQRQGLPYPLQAGSRVKRGPKGAQSTVYPPIKCSIEDAQLRLTGVHFHARNLILQFASDHSDEFIGGPWWMQVQLLTHTVVQIYEAKQWHERISKVHKEKRGFYVGMALDFGEYVMTFLTLDNLFKVMYARSRETLDAPMHDIYSDFERTVELIIDWAQSRVHLDRSGLAIHAIRNAYKIFLGIGVYTIVEIFHLAGLLPILTEEEVFDNPSRLARLIEAFFSYASHAETEMGEFLRPCLGSNHFLAVRNEDRLEYKKWLMVYGKDRTWVSTRWALQHAELTDWFTQSRHSESGCVRSSAVEFFDLFEPTYLRAGLQKVKNLGGLIFGAETWEMMGGGIWENDPLSQYFLNRGLISAPTFLHPSVLLVQPLYLSSKEMLKSWKESFMYYTDSKPFWCAFGQLPSKSIPLSSRAGVTQPNVEMASSIQRQDHLFDTLVKFSKEYVVGPLDYCGIARIHHNRTIICKNDPILSEHFAILFEANFERRRHLKVGKQKVANPEVAKLKRKYSNKRNISVKEVAGCNENEDGATDEQPAKRRRLSADKRLALNVVQA